MSRSKRDRANQAFGKPAKAGKAPRNEQEVERRAVAAKIARLRALRLARDEAEATSGKSKPKPRQQAKPE